MVTKIKNFKLLDSSLNYQWIFSLRKFYYNKMANQKFNIFITRIEEEIPRPAIEILKEKCVLNFWKKPGPIPHEDLLFHVKDVDGLFCLLTDKIDDEVIKSAGQSLKVVGSMAVGQDHLDVKTLKEKNIKIGYTPHVLTEATADLTVGLLLATSRHLMEGEKLLRSGGWKAWSPLWLCGPQIAGSTVGIFGFGRIGQAVFKRLSGFNVGKFLYTTCSEKKDFSNKINFVDFATLLKESDFIIITCSLTNETYKIFNKQAFSMMKQNAIIINTSRGDVLDQDDLIYALKNNLIYGAGLDVMTPEPLPIDSELTTLKNCVLIPHLGSATIETRTEMAVLTANNILAALEEREMPAPV